MQKKFGENIFANVVKVAISVMQSLTQDKLFSPGENFYMYSSMKVMVLFLQGPDYVWHLDGYDKLTPYGFPIHACIDGYVKLCLIMTLRHLSMCIVTLEKDCGSELQLQTKLLM